jgi:hypothetical protein
VGRDPLVDGEWDTDIEEFTEEDGFSRTRA